MSAPVLKAALAEPTPKPIAQRCVYCGTPCYGRACRSHRSLIQSDPNYGGKQ